MNLFDWFWMQLVGASDLDNAFARVEDAQNLGRIDTSLCSREGYAPFVPGVINGGIHSGLGLSLPGAGSTVVAVGSGVACDREGRRVAVGAGLNADVSRTGSTPVGQGGTPSGSGSFDTTVSAADKERWISVFVRFERALSDPQRDGSGTEVYFQVDESFVLEVRAADEAALGAGTLPPLIAGYDLLGDMRRTSTGLDSLNGHPSGNRRFEWIVREAAGDFPVRTLRVGTPREALAELLRQYNLHVRRDASTADFHFAKNVEFELDAALAWANAEAFVGKLPGAGAAGAGLTAGVQGAFKELVSDLAATAVGAGGTHRVGGAVFEGARPAGTVGGPFSVALGTLHAQLTAMAVEIAAKVNVTGDQIPGNLVPDTTVAGRQLGVDGQRWDAWLDDVRSNLLTVQQFVVSNLTPQAVDSYDLGTALLPWRAGYLKDLSVAGNVGSNLVPSDPGGGAFRDLGSVGLRWDAYLQDMSLAGYITSDFVPTTVGAVKQLGGNAPANRWYAWLVTLDLSGYVDSDFRPSDPGGGGHRDLGAAADGNRWDAYLAAVDVSGSLHPTTSGTEDFGLEDRRWGFGRMRRLTVGPDATPEYVDVPLHLKALAAGKRCLSAQTASNRLALRVDANGHLHRPELAVRQTFPWTPGAIVMSPPDERAQMLINRFQIVPDPLVGPEITLLDPAIGGCALEWNANATIAPSGELSTWRIFRAGDSPLLYARLHASAMNEVSFAVGLFTRATPSGGASSESPDELKKAAGDGGAAEMESSAFILVDPAAPHPVYAYVHRDGDFAVVMLAPASTFAVPTGVTVGILDSTTGIFQYGSNAPVTLTLPGGATFRTDKLYRALVTGRSESPAINRDLFLTHFEAAGGAYDSGPDAA